jgi:carboxyl-terminal processing protease
MIANGHRSSNQPLTGFEPFIILGLAIFIALQSDVFSLWDILPLTGGVLILSGVFYYRIADTADTAQRINAVDLILWGAITLLTLAFSPRFSTLFDAEAIRVFLVGTLALLWIRIEIWRRLTQRARATDAAEPSPIPWPWILLVKLPLFWGLCFLLTYWTGSFIFHFATMLTPVLVWHEVARRPLSRRERRQLALLSGGWLVLAFALWLPDDLFSTLALAFLLLLLLGYFRPKVGDPDRGWVRWETGVYLSLSGIPFVLLYQLFDPEAQMIPGLVFILTLVLGIGWCIIGLLWSFRPFTSIDPKPDRADRMERAYWLAGRILLTALAIVFFVKTTDYKTDTRWLSLVADAFGLDNRWLVAKALRDEYLWYDKIPPLNYWQYSSPEDLLDKARNPERDPWSYLVDFKKAAAWNRGHYAGAGMGWVINDAEEIQLRLVYPDSPAGRSGIQRGWRLIAVNDYQAKDFKVDDFAKRLTQEVGKPSVPLRLKFLKPGNEVVDLTLQSGDVHTPPILLSQVIDRPDAKIGYLAFNSFKDFIFEPMTALFSEWKQAGVNELIVDLRYNGGGSILLAAYLASLIYTPPDGTDAVFAELRYNDHYRIQEHQNFLTTPNSLEIHRLVVIATESTCSASELIINGLRPYIPVTVVGSTTCGKPLGMNELTTRSIQIELINFALFNRDGKGDYTKGLAADCPAVDDLDHPLGDPEESSLKESLFFLEHGHCSVIPRGDGVSVGPPVRTPDRDMGLTGLQREIGAW